MQLKKRIPIYLVGLAVMAFGIVLIKKANLGMSPISAIPAAVAGFAPLTLGNAVTAFQIICILFQVVLFRKITMYVALQLPLAFAFGYVIDFYMYILKFLEVSSVWLGGLICLLGIIFTALGIVIIVGTDMMLPSPDAFLRAVSRMYNKKLGNVKIVGDITWVVIALIVELVSTGKITAVGVGTLASAILTGKFVNLLKPRLPRLEMPPMDALPH